MAEPTNPLIAFSNAAAQVVERSASGIVAVHGGGRWPSSGIHWRSGVIVTAEQVLERDENIKVILPGGRAVAASLAGRDASTKSCSTTRSIVEAGIASTRRRGPRTAMPTTRPCTLSTAPPSAAGLSGRRAALPAGWVAGGSDGRRGVAALGS